ncbi:DUF2784 domain-containing protein [Ramlibacter monticola]|uniref:DUF2784 domain-containing protein n=1 Tax=Ramlibacter monticola TaxID=1926872 RepID=A0A936Z392_9BURK|nr:DUF2784 domain-containing protein [Ramlibacter monticola]MBL0394208.1 DUF2784 domain-containing protein [Ramlibacter monticola]
MSWRVLADAVVLLHLAFVVFAVAGGLLALRWRWVALLHLPALAWAAFVEFSGRTCPLTPLENALRAAGGEAGYEGGFVEHYLLPVLYPADLTRGLQWALGTGLVVFNLAVYAAVVWQARRHRFR